MSHREVAKALGITRQGVLLIERRALAKLALGLGFDVRDLRESVARCLIPCPTCGKLRIRADSAVGEMRARGEECGSCRQLRRARLRRVK